MTAAAHIEIAGQARVTGPALTGNVVSRAARGYPQAVGANQPLQPGAVLHEGASWRSALASAGLRAGTAGSESEMDQAATSAAAVKWASPMPILPAGPGSDEKAGAGFQDASEASVIGKRPSGKPGKKSSPAVPPATKQAEQPVGGVSMAVVAPVPLPPEAPRLSAQGSRTMDAAERIGSGAMLDSPPGLGRASIAAIPAPARTSGVPAMSLVQGKMPQQVQEQATTTQAQRPNVAIASGIECAAEPTTDSSAAKAEALALPDTAENPLGAAAQATPGSVPNAVRPDPASVARTLIGPGDVQQRARGAAPQETSPEQAFAAAGVATAWKSTAPPKATPTKPLQANAVPQMNAVQMHPASASVSGSAQTAMPNPVAVITPANAATGDGARSSSSAAPAPTVHETFAALDAGGGPASPAWMHTNPHQAEAGYEDPTLGWVSVRAQAGAGGVHASLVPVSADSAQSLSGHLAGLAAYLSDRQPQVQSLHVAAPEHSWGGQAMGNGTGQGSGHNLGQGGGQDSGQDAYREQAAGASMSASSIAAAMNPARLAETAPIHGEATGVPANESMYVSVMA